CISTLAAMVTGRPVAGMPKKAPVCEPRSTKRIATRLSVAKISSSVWGHAWKGGVELPGEVVMPGAIDGFLFFVK
ncbi:MAG TPA: hypothetical protein VFV78_12435, partial [Vicinamibacterales bacterium]|nr:hypothetical protein [Vicinamibacterales bacterium]